MPARSQQRRNEAPLSLLDAFDFDESIPVMSDVEEDSRTDTDAPLMLGDYSEKGHFPPSSSILRNEVLEAVSVSVAVADGGDTGPATGHRSEVMAFQCIYCKDVKAKERASCSVVIPRNLMSILDCFVEFQQIHMNQCACIPRDTKECYLDFKTQEGHNQPFVMIADDPFLWISSAIRRGLRDKKGGGIVYCPELSEHALFEEEFTEPNNYFEHENLQFLKDSRVVFGEHPKSTMCDELMTMSNAQPIPAHEAFW